MKITIEYSNHRGKYDLYFMMDLNVSPDFLFDLELFIKEDDFRESTCEISGTLPLNIKAHLKELIQILKTNKTKLLECKRNPKSEESMNVVFLNSKAEKETVSFEIPIILNAVESSVNTTLSYEINLLKSIRDWMLDLSEVKNTLLNQGIDQFSLMEYKADILGEKRKNIRDSIHHSEEVFCTLSYLETGQRISSFFGNIKINSDLTFQAIFDSFSRQENYTMSFSGFIPVYLEDGLFKLNTSPLVLDLLYHDVIQNGTSADDCFYFYFKNIHRPNEIIKANLEISSGRHPKFKRVPDEHLDVFFEHLSVQLIDFMMDVCNEKEGFLRKGIHSIKIKE